MSGLITLPRMGETMESGRVTAWLKKPGDTFERGETIAEIETDKVTVEMPALDAGRLVEILVPEGGEVSVGATLGRYDAADSTPAPTAPAREPVPAGRSLAEVVLPRMGETMEEGRLSAWLKRPGQAFKRGEMLAEIETDKVTVEMPALADGEMVEILVQEGESVAVGTPIARYATTGDVPAAPTGPAAAKPDMAPPRPASPPTAPPPAAMNGDVRRRATPLGRRLARQGGLELADVAGSGRRGRIEKGDVEAALAGRAAPAPTAPTSMPAVRVLDIPQGRMAYREWAPASAERRTILLLHGFGADGATWAAVAAALARDGARVVAADLPGHGATSIAAPDFEAVCDATAAFAQALDLQAAPVVAHSMGGAVAVRLAAEGRLRPAALTLVAPAGLGGEIDADFIHSMASVTTGGALSHLLRRLASHAPTLSRPQLDAMARDFAEGRLRKLADALAPSGRQGIDIVADLAAVAVPIRLVWGLEDRILPWTQVAAAPARAAIHLVSDAGHMPHWDKPQELAALLR